MRPLQARAGLACLALVAGVAFAQPAVPPGPPPAGDMAYTYHGTRVADPFRSLEDLSAPATRNWMLQQGDWARSQLDAIPGRAALAARIAALTDASGEQIRRVVPLAGGAVFYVKRAAGEGQFKLMFRARADAAERVLFDPNARVRPGGPPLSIDEFEPSWDGRRVAFLLAEGGSEQSELHVLDVASGRELVDPVPRIGGDSLAWAPDSRTLTFNQLRPLEVRHACDRDLPGQHGDAFACGPPRRTPAAGVRAPGAAGPGAGAAGLRHAAVPSRQPVRGGAHHRHHAARRPPLRGPRRRNGRARRAHPLAAHRHRGRPGRAGRRARPPAAAAVEEGRAERPHPGTRPRAAGAGVGARARAARRGPRDHAAAAGAAWRALGVGAAGLHRAHAALGRRPLHRCRAGAGRQRAAGRGRERPQRRGFRVPAALDRAAPRVDARRAWRRLAAGGAAPQRAAAGPAEAGGPRGDGARPRRRAGAAGGGAPRGPGAGRPQLRRC